MNRLTKLSELSGIDLMSKYEVATDWNNPLSIRDGANKIYEAIDKLGELEDIEEDLGIDLLLLFKVAKADKIYNKFNKEIQEWNNFKIDLKNNKVWYSFNPGLGYGASRKLSDYGITWALSKGELE